MNVYLDSLYDLNQIIAFLKLVIASLYLNHWPPSFCICESTIFPQQMISLTSWAMCMESSCLTVCWYRWAWWVAPSPIELDDSPHTPNTLYTTHTYTLCIKKKKNTLNQSLHYSIHGEAQTYYKKQQSPNQWPSYPPCCHLIHITWHRIKAYIIASIQTRTCIQKSNKRV